jgi:hypothetical protein
MKRRKCAAAVVAQWKPTNGIELSLPILIEQKRNDIIYVWLVKLCFRYHGYMRRGRNGGLGRLEEKEHNNNSSSS